MTSQRFAESNHAKIFAGQQTDLQIKASRDPKERQ
jgi:hypothetical protein